MSFSSNSVIAKARAVYGQSLTREDYAVLCAKSSVAEVCEFLLQTERYGKALSPSNPQTVHRGQMEALLQKSMFDTLKRFHSFDTGNSRQLFDYFLLRHEIELVLAAIEGVAAHSETEYIAALPIYMNERSKTDLLALGKARSFLDIDAVLSSVSFYSKPLRPLLIEAQKSGTINIRECERRLYTKYYMKWLKAIDKGFSKKEKKELRRSVLKSIDMENVVTCYRMGAFFKLSGEAVKQALIPFRYRLSDEVTDRLIAAGSAEEIRKELSAIGYRADSAASLDTVELLTERISLDYLRKSLRLSQSAAVVYFSLTECLGIEIKNIRTVIEGIRYGMPASEIFNMLVI